MEAQLSWARSCRRCDGLVWPLRCCRRSVAQAAGYRTTNFTVDAPTPQLAKEIGDAAEALATRTGMEWLGHELPRWSEAVPDQGDVRAAPGRRRRHELRLRSAAKCSTGG